MKKHFYYAMAFLLFLTASCVSEKIETQEDRANYNPETVWEYNGDITTLTKVIQELKNSPNREKLERRLLKNDVLWENAEPIIIDNKKRILVPFLSINKDNVIGILSLVKGTEGKITFDMVVRKDIMNKSTTLPFWKRGVWAGYFMALDKEILGIKNGSPGLMKKPVSEKVKSSNSKTMEIVCDNVPVTRICITYWESESSDGGETWGDWVPIDEYCYYEYEWQCWDEPVECPSGYEMDANGNCVPIIQCPSGYERDANGNCVLINECEEYYKKSGNNKNVNNYRVLTNKNNLCGTYNFKAVGEAYIVNISGLGFSAMGPYCHVVNAQLPTVCITIPNYNLPLALCSAKFNVAWSSTMNEVMTYLNNVPGLVIPTTSVLQGLILELLTANLNYQAGLNPYVKGVSIITGTCPGANYSKAIYCP